MDVSSMQLQIKGGRRNGKFSPLIACIINTRDFALKLDDVTDHFIKDALMDCSTFQILDLLGVVWLSFYMLGDQKIENKLQESDLIEEYIAMRL